jgi:CRISPR-associated protein Csd1
MLLQRLVGYSQRISLPPCLYAETPVDWLIDLDANGAPRGMVDLRQGSGKQKRGQSHPAPTLGNLRTSAIMPLLLCDNGGYVLGLAAKGKNNQRVQQQHDAFKQLVAHCHQQLQLPETRAVHEFYQHHFAKLPIPSDYDPAKPVTFRVNGQWVIDLPAVQQFWAKYAASEYEIVGAPMECLVCGRLKPAVRRHYFPIKGIPGGQSSGMSLISANADAFESYQLTEGFVSPICLDCSERALKALDALMRDPNTSLRVGKLVYCFWTRQPTQFSVVRLLDDPDPNEVKQLLQSVVQGGTPSQPQAHDFYAVALSANSARVVVRSYLETTLPAVQCNLAQWFRWQQLYASDTPVGVSRLAESLYRKPKNRKGDDQKADNSETDDRKRDDIPAHVPETLIRCAITGTPLPMSILQLAIQRNRAEQGVTDDRARLIQAVLYSHNYIQEVNESMQYPTETQNHPAYKCGRLLAVIERIQRESIGNPNTTLTDRYYGSASTTPASVFGVLLRLTQPHLSKLRKQREGLAIFLERILQDAMPDHFPITLSPIEQSLFALGYYHQRREFFTPRNTAANLTADEQPTLMPEEVDNDAND